MRLGLRAYLVALFGICAAWLWLRWPAGALQADPVLLPTLVLLAGLYFASHLMRMMRLALLTLDVRSKIFPLIAAHALTAFPSSFLPYKLGELLRLAAFHQVLGGARKAGVVWAVERFSDVAVIACFICGLYMARVEVPPSMKRIFVLFVVLTVLCLLTMLAVAKVFIYLNRHLVLVSRSRHGLVLLKVSHAVRQLQLEFRRSVEGRVPGLVLLSVLIWATEAFALSLFMGRFAIDEPQFAALFSAGLLASVAGMSALGPHATVFGLYQSLALVAMTGIFITTVWAVRRVRPKRNIA